MHLLKSISIAVSLLLFIFVNTHAQTSSSSLNYSLDFNRGSYNTMQQRAGERGISASDFGQWLADNGRAGLKASKEGIPVPNITRCTLYLVDQNGSIQQSASTTFSFRSSGGDMVSLGRLVSSQELAGLLERVFLGLELVNDPPTFFPDSNFFPDTTFFPETTFLSSTRELDRMVANYGRQALSRADKVGQRGFALFITITPDADRFEQDVSPGGTGFVGSF